MRRTIRPSDAEWPECLSEIEPLDPPEQLRADGLPLPTDAPSVAVVGTRTPSGAGIETAMTLARAFAEAGFTVVSGLAVGIDAVAHRAALDAGGHTVAVLGAGLDIDYPKANRGLREHIEERGTSSPSTTMRSLLPSSRSRGATASSPACRKRSSSSREPPPPAHS